MKLSDKAHAALDRVVEQFQSGDLSPVIKIACLQRQGDPLPSEKWSLCNRILAYIGQEGQGGTLFSCPFVSHHGPARIQISRRLGATAFRGEVADQSRL
jgi:hypothetical protein